MENVLVKEVFRQNVGLFRLNYEDIKLELLINGFLNQLYFSLRDKD